MQKAKVMVFIGVLLVLGGCNKAKEAAQEEAKAAKVTPEVLKVKDLYIGMDINEVPAIMKRHLANTEWKVSNVKKTTDIGIGGLDDPLDNNTVVIMIGNNLFGGIIAADKNDKVRTIYLTAVDDLFNSADMRAEEFANKFMSSYNIPMEPVNYGWEYKRPDGLRVVINLHKNILIQRIVSESEGKFD